MDGEMTLAFKPAERVRVKLNPEDLYSLRPLKRNKKGEAGFRDSVIVTERGCWLWQGAKTQWGYGVRDKRVIHRLAYEEVHGPVDRSLDLDHLCRTRSCCNPSHLEPVTRTENLRRGLGVGQTHHTARLTDVQRAEAFRKYHEGTGTLSSLGRDYGVTKQAIYYIVRHPECIR